MEVLSAKSPTDIRAGRKVFSSRFVKDVLDIVARF